MQRRAKDHNTDLFRELAIPSRAEHAWGAIYCVYWGAVVRFVSMSFSIIDRQDAEDIADEAFIKLWRKRETVAQHDIPKDWLFRCARNDALDFLKRRDRRKQDPLTEGHEEIPDDSPALDDTESKQRRDAMKEAVARLPPETRRALMMKYLDGIGNREIAERLRKSPQTIANQLLRGVRRLQQWMNAEKSTPKKNKDAKNGNDD